MDIRDERFLEMLDKCRNSEKYYGVIIFDNNQRRDDFIVALRRQSNRDYVVSTRNRMVSFDGSKRKKIETYVLGHDGTKFRVNSVDEVITDFTTLTDGNLRIIYNAFVYNMVKGSPCEYEETEELENFLNEFNLDAK